MNPLKHLCQDLSFARPRVSPSGVLGNTNPILSQCLAFHPNAWSQPFHGCSLVCSVFISDHIIFYLVLILFKKKLQKVPVQMRKRNIKECVATLQGQNGFHIFSKSQYLLKCLSLFSMLSLLSRTHMTFFFLLKSRFYVIFQC